MKAIVNYNYIFNTYPKVDALLIPMRSMIYDKRKTAGINQRHIWNLKKTAERYIFSRDPVWFAV